MQLKDFLQVCSLHGQKQFPGLKVGYKRAFPTHAPGKKRGNLATVGKAGNDWGTTLLLKEGFFERET